MPDSTSSSEHSDRDAPINCSTELSDNDEDDSSASTTFRFHPQNYKCIAKRIKPHEFYAVDYGDSCYIGKVESIVGESITCKFLNCKRKPNYR